MGWSEARVKGRPRSWWWLVVVGYGCGSCGFGDWLWLGVLVPTPCLFFPNRHCSCLFCSFSAYMNKDNNPNAYHYRFNDVGEIQGKGKFTKEEKKRFKKLIAKGVDYRWGLFSIKFPGRVGYQCSNFYRQF